MDARCSIPLGRLMEQASELRPYPELVAWQAIYARISNAAGGGVYATEWTSDFIKIWYFQKGQVPSDITNGNPNPSGWGMPAANFAGCNFDQYFRDMNIVSAAVIPRVSALLTRRTDIRQHVLWRMGGECCLNAISTAMLMNLLRLGLGLGSVILCADQS